MEAYKNMEAYLDNSATTKVSQSVKDVVAKTMTEDFGNPSSMHMRGVEAEKYISQGMLVPDDVTIKIVEERLKSHVEKKIQKVIQNKNYSINVKNHR